MEECIEINLELKRGMKRGILDAKPNVEKSRGRGRRRMNFSTNEDGVLMEKE